MNRRPFTLLVLLSALASPPNAYAAPSSPIPAAVKAFVARRAECQHWAGEEPYDAARRAQINRAVLRLRCARLDRDEALLRRRYGKNPNAIRALDQSPDAL